LLLKVYDGLSQELDGLQGKVTTSRKAFEQSLAPLAVSISNVATTENSSFVKTETTGESQDTKEKAERPVVEENLLTLIHDREIQVDILPPIDIAMVSEIITNLYDLPEVEDAELITEANSPSIVVLQSKPIGLAEFSKSLVNFPQIEEARVIEDESTAVGGKSSDGKRPRRIEIVLAKAAVEG
jgi:hypothetical protein